MANSDGSLTLNDLREGLEEVESLMGTLDKKQEVALAELKGVLGQMATDVKYLLTAVRDGNGKAPMVVRVQMLERSVGEVEQSMEAVLEELKAIREDLSALGEKVAAPEVGVARIQGKWAAAVALIGAAVGSIPGVLALILK